MTRLHFDKELERLNERLQKMGNMVEESIEKAICALETQDSELADEIMKNDDSIDDLEKEIETSCLRLIAMQQPLAGDLRNIGAILKIITDMERIADHSSDISELTIRMANVKYIKPLIDIPQMAEIARLMVKDAIDAFIRKDIKMAKSVCKRDEEADDLFMKIIIDLVAFMKKDSKTIEQAIDLMFIAKYLERIADHATNIGEWAVYNITGEHDRLATLYKNI